MTAAVFHNQVGDAVAAMRSERTRHEIAEMLDDERKRIADIETEIESRAWHFAPADRAKLERARRMLTNAALTALTGSPQEENSK